MMRAVLMVVPFHAHSAWPAHVFGDAWDAVTEEQVRDALGELRRSVSKPSARFVEEVALPLAGWLSLRARSGRLTAAVSGPPGSGKSTLVRALRSLLPRLFGLSAAGFSLDDVYRTKAERVELAREVHPLLATRGVPGTHDLELAHRLLDELEGASGNRTVWLPKFDKLADDRAPPDRWEKVEGRVDVILLDGWFWGTDPGDEASLDAPINAREATQDPDGRFRRWVRAQLAGPYPALFARAGAHVALAAPSWQTSVDWRVAQELDLLGLAGPPSDEVRKRISHFLLLFERIVALPAAKEPDLVVALDDRHELRHLGGSALRAT